MQARFEKRSNSAHAHRHAPPSKVSLAPPSLSAAPDFPVVYASGIAGIAGPSPDELADNLEPLLDMIVREVAPPAVQVRRHLFVGPRS